MTTDKDIEQVVQMALQVGGSRFAESNCFLISEQQLLVLTQAIRKDEANKWEREAGMYPTKAMLDQEAEAQAKRIERLQAQVAMLREVMKTALETMEYDAIAIEGEWGSCRGLKEMEAAGELPEIVQVRQALSETSSSEQWMKEKLLEDRIESLQTFADSINYKISYEEGIEQRIAALRKRLNELRSE